MKPGQLGDYQILSPNKVHFPKSIAQQEEILEVSDGLKNIQQFDNVQIDKLNEMDTNLEMNNQLMIDYLIKMILFLVSFLDYKKRKI